MVEATQAARLGTVLRLSRLAAGMTQEGLAERAGLGVRSIQAIESGESQPRLGTVQRLVWALGLDREESAKLVALVQPAPRHRRRPSFRDTDEARAERAGDDDSVRREAPLGNLPLQLTSFVGREREMAEVRRLLETTRLLTLTGTGGCGKTRLAYQVAEELLRDRPEDYLDGVWVAELAPLSDPSLVPQTIASALGLREEAGQPILDTLVDHLRPKCLLLVLDNCEHLLDASASLADALLHACPELRVLATSREALGITGETSYRVPSLALPDLQALPPLGELAAYEAVRLFVERARGVQPSFDLTEQDVPAVAQICWQLDGMPLAIELAAARLRGLTVEGIARRLDDRFRLLTGGSRTALRRQQTLRATIDWSYALLSEPERLLFRRLAVFSGGWSLEAAEEVCPGEGAEASIDQDDLLDLLLRLVDRSLVVADAVTGEERYHFPETIRQYALEKLLDSGEAAIVRDRHREWCLRFTRSLEKVGFVGLDTGTLLDQMELEHDNLRTALAWCLETSPDVGLRLAVGQRPGQEGGVFALWIMHGYPTEGRRWLSALLEAAPERNWTRSMALTQLSSLVSSQGEDSEAEVLAEEALAIGRETGDAMTVGHALVRLGGTATRQDRDRARRHFEEARSIGISGGDPFVTGWALRGLGDLAYREGNVEEAEGLWHETVNHTRNEGAERIAAFVLGNLGCLYCVKGDYRQGRACLEESIGILRKVQDLAALGVFLSWFGFFEGYGGDYARGISLLRKSLRLLRRQGHRTRLTTHLYGLGVVEVRHARWSRGVRLAASAKAALEEWRQLVPRVEREIVAARAALGEEAFAKAWAEGQAMTLEQAVEYALNDEAEV